MATQVPHYDMTFFGVSDSLEEWRDIILSEFNNPCGEIEVVDDRAQFQVKMTTDDRQHLQDNYWYEQCKCAEMPWNHCIAYGAKSSYRE